MQILIIKHGALGDVVRTTALLPALAKKFPASQIHWLTSKGAQPLLQNNSYISKVHINFSESLNSMTWDWVVSLDDEESACRFASNLQYKKLSGAYWNKDSDKNSYTPDFDLWFGMGILRPKSLGGLDEANRLKKENLLSHPEIFYQMFNLEGPPHRPSVITSSLEKQKARNWLDKTNSKVSSWVGLNTGAAPRWKYKSWGEQSTARLANRISQDFPDVGILLLGGVQELERNERILSETTAPQAYLAPTDWGLLEFTALIENCQLLVSSDSLALHLGLATNRPIVTFFGPTSATEISLYGQGEKLVSNLPCQGCYKKDCDVRPHCMESIGVTEMYQKIHPYLSQ